MTRVQYVNEADRPKVLSGLIGPVPDGDVIWNAPRPLAGTIGWTGKFVCGVYYSHGPRGRYQQRNEELDAVEIAFVTNAQVKAMVTQRLAEDGYSLDDYAEVDMDLAEVAAHYSLPYHKDR